MSEDHKQNNERSKIQSPVYYLVLYGKIEVLCENQNRNESIEIEQLKLWLRARID